MATQDYAKMKNADLESLLKERNLQTGGKKADMVARLQEADRDNAAVAQSTSASTPVTDINNSLAAPDETTISVPSAAATTATAATATTAEDAADPSTAEAGADKKRLSKEERQAKYETDEKNFASGMSTTDIQQEIEKRKKRMAKFNLTDNAEAIEGIKALERALKFHTEPIEGNKGSQNVSGLDTALTMERERKRGRGDEENGRTERKRRGGHTDGSVNRASNAAKGSNWMSTADREAAEKRKARFATGSTTTA